MPVPQAPCSAQKRCSVNAVERLDQRQSSRSGCTGKGGSAPEDSSFPGLPARVHRIGHSESGCWAGPVCVPRSARSGHPQLCQAERFSRRSGSKRHLRGFSLWRCLSLAGRPGLSDPEEGACHPLPLSTVPAPCPRPARSAPQPAGSVPSIGAAGTLARRPPTPRFSLLIEVCLSRERSGQRQKPNI